MPTAPQSERLDAGQMSLESVPGRQLGGVRLRGGDSRDERVVGQRLQRGTVRITPGAYEYHSDDLERRGSETIVGTAQIEFELLDAAE
jgi:hypothetical protein